MIGKIISHYKILDKIGSGGMGDVYLAQDTKLDRKVAVKFLPPHLTSDSDNLARFRREAKTAAALNHPNVCVIYDILDDQDPPCIVMEYVTGKTLRAKIEETSDDIEIDDIISYASQIAEALKAAHDKEIIHRDVKSDNIILSENNRIKVMDFGLAKLRGDQKITKTSSTLGTLSYMAPEQLEGKEIDQRSDIFSFGVVLYEMVTRRLPFTGNYEAAIIYAILNDDPLPVSEYRSDIPVELLHIISRSLEKNPDERYQSLDDMLIDLRRLKRDTSKITGSVPVQNVQAPSSGRTSWRNKKNLIIVFAAFIVIAVTLALIYLTPEKDDKIDTLAILPFINTSGDKETEYLSDGIPESIISNMQKIPDLRVASFSSVLYRYKDKVYDPVVVGDEMNVESVAMGRLTLQGDNVSINIEIIDTRDNSIILAKQYIEKLANLFEIQTKIAGDITDNLRLELTGQQRKEISAKPQVDPQAYQNYLKGRHFWYKRNPEDFKKAVAYFKAAIETDPNYALAYSGLADTYRLQTQYSGLPQYRTLPAARHAAEKAMALDSLSAESLTSLGGVLSEEGKYTRAEKLLKRAIQINPNYILAYHWLGICYNNSGKLGERVKIYERALELDPMSPIISGNLATAYAFHGQVDRSIELHKKNIKLFPDHPTPYQSYALTLGFMEDHENAIKMAREAVKRDSLSFWTNIGLAWALRNGGKYEESLAWCRKMKQMNPEFAPAAHIMMGMVYSITGDNDKSVLNYLEAQRLDPLAAIPYLFLGNYYITSCDYERAIEQFEKRISLYPEYSDNYYEIGLILAAIGEYQDAIEQYTIAADLDPVYNDQLGFVYYHAGEYDKAEEKLLLAIKNNPEITYPREYLALNYYAQKKIEQGIEQFQTYLNILEFPERDSFYKEAFVSGDFSEANLNKYYRLIIEKIEKDNIPVFEPSQKAVYYALAGMPGESVTYLNKAFDKKDESLCYMITTPVFDEYHVRPEFKEIIKRLKLDKYRKFD